MGVKVSFEKKHTAITKGILIIMMIIHHVLSEELVNQYNVQTIVNKRLLISIVSFCKICISGFAFLSAYGMTCGLKKQNNKQVNFYFKFMGMRLIKLESSLVFIYILAVLYKRFIMMESIKSLYDLGRGFKIVYMFIDSIGMSTYFSTPQINITWWYLYFAILLILTMPFLYMLYERFRYLILPMSILLPMAVSPLEVRAGIQSNYAMLLPSVMLGIAFAYEGWFEKIWLYKRTISTIWVRVIILIVMIKLAFDVWCDVSNAFGYIFVVVIPLSVFEIIAGIPILNYILKIIGENATNIFLTHTFIYYYWYTEAIYSMKIDWCIVLMTIVSSIVLSMIIELLKKVSCYNRMVNYILNILFYD